VIYGLIHLPADRKVVSGVFCVRFRCTATGRNSLGILTLQSSCLANLTIVCVWLMSQLSCVLDTPASMAPNTAGIFSVFYHASLRWLFYNFCTGKAAFSLRDINLIRLVCVESTWFCKGWLLPFSGQEGALRVNYNLDSNSEDPFSSATYLWHMVQHAPTLVECDSMVLLRYLLGLTASSQQIMQFHSL
jgi:hypothetical protein